VGIIEKYKWSHFVPRGRTADPGIIGVRRDASLQENSIWIQ